MEKANFLVNPTNGLLSGNLKSGYGRLIIRYRVTSVSFSLVNKWAHPVCQFAAQRYFPLNFPQDYL